MKKVYPVIFTMTDNEVLIEVPDMEIMTQANDMYSSIEMARDAIGIKGISMEDDGQIIPEASSVESIDIKKSVTATDTCGNDITDKIITIGRYTFDQAGEYSITYKVTDAIGSTDTKTIKLTVIN